MKMFKKAAEWGDTHHPVILDVFRLLLGLFLVLKGYAFLQNQQFLADAVRAINRLSLPAWMFSAIMFYVIFVHMAGGLFIFLGIYTRVAALFQLPVIAGAIMVAGNLKSDLNSNLWLSVLCLAFLLLFILIGSGPLSVDYVAKEIESK